MIGTTMLNEETMHTRVGDMKGQSQGGYTGCGNSIRLLEPPQGNQGCKSNENYWRNWSLATKRPRPNKNYKEGSIGQRQTLRGGSMPKEGFLAV